MKSKTIVPYAWLTIVDGAVLVAKQQKLDDLPSLYDKPAKYVTINTVASLKRLIEKWDLHYLMCSSVFYDKIKTIKNPALSALMNRVVLVENFLAYAFTHTLFDENTTDSEMEGFLALRKTSLQTMKTI